MLDLCLPCILLSLQRSHLSPGIITVLETDPAIERAAEEARIAQEERLKREADEMMRIRKEAEERAGLHDRDSEVGGVHSRGICTESTLVIGKMY